jgi:ferredoxin-NADP reductase
MHLIERRSLSDEVGHFVFHVDFEHVAGQYVALSAELGGETQKRYYSIASAPREDRTIDLCIDVRGDFGQYLNALEAGAEVSAEGPAGKMCLLGARNSAVYFASGTGIAPVRAILQTHLAENPDANARLYFGARHSKNLFFRDEFEVLAERHLNFEFCPTVSGDDADWSGRRGRVLAHLEDALKGGEDLDAYFCGQRELVDQLKTDLTAAGIPDERQSYERY